jgi:TonB family protein
MIASCVADAAYPFDRTPALVQRFMPGVRIFYRLLLAKVERDQARTCSSIGRMALRGTQVSVLIALALQTSAAAFTQDVVYPRLLLNTTTSLGSIEKKVDPIKTGRQKGSVLVVFRTSERGVVIDARVVSGSPELEDSALRAVNQWKFRPTSIDGGHAVQISSAAVIDFSQNRPEIHAPKPMTAQQLTPGLQFQCLNQLLRQSPGSVAGCEQQLDTAERSNRTPMDRFTAADEYGLALMDYAKDARRAVDYFSKAIQLAAQRLTSSDAEWAYAYWHRAVAEQRCGDNSNSERDFSAAEASMESAERSIGVEKIAVYYRTLLNKIVNEHVRLLESENRGDEAEKVRAKIGQP